MRYRERPGKKPLFASAGVHVVAVVLAASMLPFLPWLALASIAVLLVIGWVRRCAPVVQLGVIGLPVGTLAVLEVTVNRIPVAELYDYRNDGFIDELFLTGPPGHARFGEWRYRRYRDWDDDRRPRTRRPW